MRVTEKPLIEIFETFQNIWRENIGIIFIIKDNIHILILDQMQIDKLNNKLIYTCRDVPEGFPRSPQLMHQRVRVCRGVFSAHWENFTEVLLNQPEITFSDWFGSKRTQSVWTQINRKMVNTIWFQVDLTRLRKKFSAYGERHLRLFSP